MRPRTLTLTDAERADLERTRSRDKRPYLREKAAALLQIADGTPAYLVARSGLLKPRHPETIRFWLDDYEQTRTLRPQPARRKRLSPSVLSEKLFFIKCGSPGKCSASPAAAGRYYFYASTAPS